MDLSKLSDQDLLALHSKKYDQLSDEGLMYLQQQHQAPQGEQPNKFTSLTSDDFTKPGEMIPKDSGIGNFLRYSAAHMDPTSKENLQNIGFASGGIADMAGAGLKRGAQIASKYASEFLEPAAQRSEVLSKVKNPASVEPYVGGQINDAAEMFNKKQIAPRMLEQQARMEGQSVKLRPEDFMGLSPELDKMASQYGGLNEIPATDALKLRAELNKVTGWKMHPMDQTKALATDAKAADLHQRLANEFSSIDPSMEQLSDELKQSYNTRKAAVGGASKNPIGTVNLTDSVAGLAKKGRLAAFDEQAGSDLSGLGRNLKKANDAVRPTTLSDIFSIHGPKHVVQKTIGPMGRAYDSGAANIAQPTLDALQKLLGSPQADAAAGTGTRILSPYIKRNTEDEK